MEINGRDKITSKQLIFIMIGSMLGSGVLSLPRLTAEIVGQDSWIGVILGAMFPLVSFSLISLLYRRNNDDSFVSLCKTNGGKWLGGVFSAILALYSILAASILLRVFIEIITMFFLTETPLFFKLVLMLGAVAYLVSGSIKVLGRVNEFLFYALLPLIFFSLPAVLSNSDILNLMPVFNHKMTDYAKASLTTGFAFSGFELFIVFHPHVSRRKEIYRAGLYALLITLTIYLYVVIGTIAVFGSELTQIFTWPTLRVLATSEVPLFERIEFLFIQAWIGVSFRPISIQYFCAVNIVTELFNIKSRRLATLAVFSVIIAIAYYPHDLYQVFKLSDYIGISALALGIALPCILIILGLFRKRKEAGQSGMQ